MVLRHAPLLMAAGDVAQDLKKVPFTEEDMGVMRGFFKRGISVGQTARHLNRHYNSVYKVFTKWRKHGAT